jgi:chorismate dehydratase
MVDLRYPKVDQAIKWRLKNTDLSTSPAKFPTQKFRVGAVSYLNTVPLVYGMLHGPQQQLADVTFSIPSICAEQVESGVVQIGLVPVVEITRQSLEIVPGVGIAACGAVRSILLVSKRPWTEVRTLAADVSSRTSVQLARVILRERYGVTPAFLPNEPDLPRMLEIADAALIIGDPALRIDLEALPFEWLDLAGEWFAMTGLPFVFAAWAGKPGLPLSSLSDLTLASYRYGLQHILDIAKTEAGLRGISRDLAERYLRYHLRYEIGTKEQQGLETFLSLAGLTGVRI